MSPPSTWERRPVRGVQIGDCQDLSLHQGGVNHALPSSLGDSLAPFPPVDRVLLLIQGGRHSPNRAPNRKYVVKRLHISPYLTDYLSVQGRIEKQVTPLFPDLTMVGMRVPRKASTPSTWRKDFIKRVRDARIASGKKPVEVAAQLVVSLDTYNRWETRALLPHHLIVPFCRITGADPMELMTGVPFDLGKALSQQPR